MGCDGNSGLLLRINELKFRVENGKRRKYEVLAERFRFEPLALELPVSLVNTQAYKQGGWAHFRGVERP